MERAQARARAARLAAPRRGTRPPVVVPRRVVPIDPRPPNAVARRPRMLTAKAAALPPDRQPEIGPSETKSDTGPTGTSSAASPGSARGRATSNPRRRRPRIGRETALRGGASCGSPYGPNYELDNANQRYCSKPDESFDNNYCNALPCVPGNVHYCWRVACQFN